MASLSIEDPKEFNALISALATDVMYARFHLDLLHIIWRARGQYTPEFAQSPWFWRLTEGAHLEAGLVKLARAYDTEDKGLHLSSWLDTIAENVSIFSEESFRARLAGNPFVESLANRIRVPDQDQLAKDRESVSMGDPDVKRLIVVRHNALAHRSGKLVLKGRNPFTEYGLSTDTIYALAARAVDIVNRYVDLFKAETFSVKPSGQSDLIGLLALAEKGRECLDGELAAEEESL